MQNTDGEAVIMLAFQASGRGSTPLQCNLIFVTFYADCWHKVVYDCLFHPTNAVKTVVAS